MSEVCHSCRLRSRECLPLLAIDKITIAEITGEFLAIIIGNNIYAIEWAAGYTSFPIHPVLITYCFNFLEGQTPQFRFFL